MFWGREDVYAKRSKYGGYFPQCENRWNEKLCLKQCGGRKRIPSIWIVTVWVTNSEYLVNRSTEGIDNVDPALVHLLLPVVNHRDVHRIVIGSFVADAVPYTEQQLQFEVMNGQVDSFCHRSGL